MSEGKFMNVDRERLLNAWKDTLPTILNPGDTCKIILDQADESALRVHINTVGHSEYSFDFKVAYVDDREVRVSLVDVEKAGESVDEHTEIIQTLIEDDVRHLHECAQALQRLTHA